MITKLKNIIQSFKKAEKIENSRAKTYKKYYEQVSFSAGKDVLDFLYKAELEHLKFLKDQEKSVLNGKKIDISKVKDKPFKFKRRFLFKGLNNLDSDIRILESAVKLEEADVKFYKEQMRKTNDFNAREFFGKMAKIEFTHLKLLKITIERARFGGVSLSNLHPKNFFTKLFKEKKKKNL